jgi:hypothetical protein
MKKIYFDIFVLLCSVMHVWRMTKVSEFGELTYGSMRRGPGGRSCLMSTGRKSVGGWVQYGWSGGHFLEENFRSGKCAFIVFHWTQIRLDCSLCKGRHMTKRSRELEIRLITFESILVRNCYKICSIYSKLATRLEEQRVFPILTSQILEVLLIKWISRN